MSNYRDKRHGRYSGFDRTGIDVPLSTLWVINSPGPDDLIDDEELRPGERRRFKRPPPTENSHD